MPRVESDQDDNIDDRLILSVKLTVLSVSWGMN